MRTSRLAIFLLIPFILAGCGSTSIYVPVTRPIELNLQGMERIGIALYYPSGITSEYHLATEDALSTAFGSTIAADGRFELVNLYDYIQRLDRSIDEKIFTSGNIAGIAKAVNVQGLIFGEIRQLKYDEDIIQADVHRYQGPDGKQIVRKGLLRMTVLLRVVNPATNSIIWEESVYEEIRAETSAADREPAMIDPVPLAMDAAANLAREILELTKQVNESVLVTFLNDPDIPDIKKGIKFAKAGDWGRTLSIFKRLAEEADESSVEHKLRYNLGIAYQYSYNFRLALENFERALELEDGPRYQLAIDDCLKMEQSYLELVNHK